MVGNFGVVEVLLSEHAQALAGGDGVAVKAAILTQRAGPEASRSALIGAITLVMIEGRCHTLPIAEFEPALRRIVAGLAQAGRVVAH
ncbi:MAG: hypothetical protein U5L05_07255 [Rubrivivax sp.]|nr:hypothetical protein [Rubrivivax sp.]